MTLKTALTSQKFSKGITKAFKGVLLAGKPLAWCKGTAMVWACAPTHRAAKRSELPAGGFSPKILRGGPGKHGQSKCQQVEPGDALE